MGHLREAWKPDDVLANGQESESPGARLRGSLSYVSIVRLREELDSTIGVLAAHVERIDRLVLAGGDVAMAERGRGLDMLLTAVMRTWLDGENPDLARIVSALDRVGA